MSRERRFTVQLRPEPEGGFTVLVPALPEVVTYGADEDEAMDNAREAIELAIDVRRDEGEEIPEDVATRIRSLIVAA